ncbi:plasmid recombination protein [Enterocloster alcoholdehydrogenati]|jgi:Txe/YoeB family toxin of Txe-Axe toxin-antitoxin module|uniref:plasmid recombination protein n=1 Tax=Enterocloster TaxID=2719313 RepID=UPI001593479E|nr:plasmid recombination protein [Enterocloster alcoholdehydrogenati]
MMGKGSINHNTRAFSAKNVDTERSIYNVEFCHAEIEEVYHELFVEALERYNAKQKRNDRKIDNYYEKIRQGKQEKLFHEAVFQIGNKDDMNAKSEEGQLAKEILIEFMKDFQKRNPYLHVFSAHLHMDEETPHVHVDFVPVICNSKRGLDTRVSLKGALGEQGFKGGTRGATEWNQWIESEKQEIAQIMGKYGIEWKQLGTHNKHLSVLDFEKQERAKEVAELEAKKESLEEHNAAILETSEKWLGELENLEQEIHSAQENREEADKRAEVAKKEAARYEKKLAEIAPMVKDMERFAVKYSYDPEEVLPEAGTLESGKTYREKKTKPLIEKIIMVLRSVYREYLNISNRFEKLQDAYSREQDRNERLKNRLEESLEENRELRTITTDFGRVKKVMGAEQVNAVIDRAKQQEQIEAEQKRTVRRKHNREAR